MVLISQGRMRESCHTRTSIGLNSGCGTGAKRGADDCSRIIYCGDIVMMVEDASGSVTVTDATVARCNTGTRQQMLPARTSTLTSMKSAIIHVCV